MSGTTRAFFALALLGLVIAALLHLLVQAGLTSLWTALIHLSLFGWITAMILGVTYHTMPVFSGRRFPYPRLSQAHCLAFSLGITVATVGLAVHQDSLINTGIAFQTVAASLFVANVVLLLRRGAAQPGGHPVPPIPGQSEIDRIGSLATSAAGLSLPLALLLLLGVYTDVLSGAWLLAAEHLATLGWIMLMIVGVAIHILPRFSGRGSRGPIWARFQLWTHLAALMLLIVGLGFGWTVVFAIGAAGMATALALFAWTIWPTVIAVQAGPAPIQLRLKERIR